MFPSIDIKTLAAVSAIGLAILSHGPMVYAGHWELTSSVTATGTYTDNINLEPDTDKESELVGQFLPGFSLTREASQLRTEFSYLGQAALYAKESKSSDILHQFAGDATAEIVRERFFLDANTTFGQQVIDPAGKISESTINVTDNRTDVFTTRVNPSWRQNLSTFARASVDYTFGMVRFLDDGATNDIEDSVEHSAEVTIRNPARARRFGWVLAYEWDRVEFEDDKADIFQRGNAELTYQVSRSVTLIGLAGYEDNDLDAIGDADGEVWEVGIGWQPTPSDKLEARYGRRFFGSTKSFQWIHAGQRITTEVSFSEDFTTSNQALLDIEIVPGQGVLTDVPSRRDEVLVERRLDGRVNINLQKALLSMDVFEARRDFQHSGAEERLRGVHTTFEWRYSPRTRVTLDGLYQQGTFEGPDNEFIRISLAVERELGPRTTAFASAAHRRQEADIAENEYRENVVAMGVRRLF